jgi:hypothetical protein
MLIIAVSVIPTSKINVMAEVIRYDSRKIQSSLWNPVDPTSKG